MRGKKISDLIPSEELRRKRARCAPEPAAAASAPAAGLADRVGDALGKLTRYLKRLVVAVALTALVLVVHRSQSFHAVATVFLNTAGHSELVRSISTALPLSIVTALVTMWIREAG
jgi:hypothetical protein